MYKEVAAFSVPYLQILDEKGRVDRSLEPKLSSSDLVEMYGLMVRARLFDDKCLKLQRQGRMGTFAPVTGQEAAQVGSAYALESIDWLVPSFREVACAIARGSALAPLALYVMGYPQGAALPEGAHDLPVSIPVGSQTLHAMGIGLGLRIKGEKGVVIVYCGDGATSQGDFYEALNFSGVYKAPVIFIIQNNQYAISLPRAKQSAAETLAQKGISAGIQSIQVDGNDILGMYVATTEAIARARSGEGPTVIEALTYRMLMHTTADDPTRYRADKEVTSWKKKDPIDRFRKYLEKKKLWNSSKEKKLVAEVSAEIEAAITEAENVKPHIDDMFQFVYADMPSQLHEQLEVAKKYTSLGLRADDKVNTYSSHKVVHTSKGVKSTLSKKKVKGSVKKKILVKKKVVKRKVSKRKVVKKKSIRRKVIKKKKIIKRKLIKKKVHGSKSSRTSKGKFLKVSRRKSSTTRGSSRGVSKRSSKKKTRRRR